MEEGKVYRLHTGFTRRPLQLNHGWLWLCTGSVTPMYKDARFKSIATGAERDLPGRYFIHPPED
jgi:hypothetical protein